MTTSPELETLHARAVAAVAERRRVRNIILSPEAEGRFAAAVLLALCSEMPAAMARKKLRAIPVAEGM